MSHRPSRHSKDSKVQLIKTEGLSLKDQVVKNLIENAEDQNQEGTIVQFASAFDLQRKMDKETRISFIRKLHHVYGKENNHVLDDITCKGSLEDYTINITYPAKLNCTEDELVSEFKSIWPIITKKWLNFKDSKPVTDRIKRFWQEIVEENAIDYPNLCDLVLLLLSISPGTGPIERSFSKLAKICYKDRNSLSASTLESLYLLSAMAITEDDDDFCKHVREHLQKN